MSDIGRRIELRHGGHRRGPVTRVFSPGDLGQTLKPFVFLDCLDAPNGASPGFAFHPHSGICTLTVPLSFDLEHEASNGQIDVVRRGGIEWVLAGQGIWHRARPVGHDRLEGFQLWMALPPSHELAMPSARFVQATELAWAGPAKVLLGCHDGVVSPVPVPVDATCLWVELKDGEAWTFHPRPGHDVAWLFVLRGELVVGAETLTRELAVFERGACPIEARARGPCCFLLGAAAAHPHSLIVGPHSVHTSERALDTGAACIGAIGQQLRANGAL